MFCKDTRLCVQKERESKSKDIDTERRITKATRARLQGGAVQLSIAIISAFVMDRNAVTVPPLTFFELTLSHPPRTRLFSSTKSGLSSAISSISHAKVTSRRSDFFLGYLQLNRFVKFVKSIQKLIGICYTYLLEKTRHCGCSCSHEMSNGGLLPASVHRVPN